MAKNLKIAALFAIAATMVACSTEYDDGIAPKETPKQETKDTVKVDTTMWESPMGKNVVNIDGMIHSYIHCSNNKTAELVYPLDVEVSAPERVIGKKDSTIYYMSENETYDDWKQVYNGKDSVETTRVHKSFLMREQISGELYRIKVSYTLCRGYILIKGRTREEFLLPTVSSNYAGNDRKWIENYELNDSTFLREVLTSYIRFNAQKVETTLTSTTNIDRNGKQKSEEETPAAPSKPKIDIYVDGLSSFNGGNIVKAGSSWAVDFLFKGSDGFTIVTAPYTREVYGTLSTTFCSFSSVGDYKWQYCCYYNGKHYPATYNPDSKGWDLSYNANIHEQQDKNDATINGIWNQPKSGNANCSPIVDFTPSESAYNGYKIITVIAVRHINGKPFATTTLVVGDSKLK